MASVGLGSRRRRSIKRLARDTQAATAVEFALVSAPFMLLLFGILEMCFIFLAHTALEHGVMEASRRIRTGEFQSGGASAENFKTLACSGFLGFLGCGDNVVVDVRVFQDFNSIGAPDPLQDNVLDPNEMQFNPGGAGNIVLVRVWYRWTMLTPLIGQYFANLGDNVYAIRVATAFRNEPFDN